MNSLRSACIVAAVAAMLAHARAAHGQLAPMPGSPDGRTTMNAEGDPTKAKPIATADKTSRLFDLATTKSSLQLDLGPIWYRKQAATGPKGFERGVGEIAVGSVTTALWKPFYLAGHQKLAFRAFDSKSYHASFTSELATGVYLGPIELESRIGLNFLNLSAFHGEWSAELLSPRVSVAAAVHVGPFRVDIQAHSEYLWRWFGNDYLVRGVTLGLRLDLPRSDPPVMKKSSAPR